MYWYKSSFLSLAWDRKCKNKLKTRNAWEVVCLLPGASPIGLPIVTQWTHLMEKISMSIYIYNIYIFIDLPPKLNSTEPWLKVVKYHKFIFFSESTVTNPAIWLALSAVSIPISAHGHGNAFPSTSQSSLTFFPGKYLVFPAGQYF